MLGLRSFNLRSQVFVRERHFRFRFALRVPRLNHLRLQTDLVKNSQQKRVYCSPQNARALKLKIFRYTPTFASPRTLASGRMAVSFLSSSPLVD